ncbi:putative WD domain, G-beta repeat [Trypanosoma cruzi]|nr:putative WD domain, G-beta repeat [Trypanosoma cruzi]
MDRPFETHIRAEEVEEEEEAEDPREAFLDLDDPNNVILDESKMAEIEDDDNDDDGGGRGEEETQSCGARDVDEVGDAEDLNGIPDREPDRDDALCVFRGRDGHPLHAVTAHPHDTQIFAASGESDEVYILRLASDRHTVETRAVLQGHSDTVSLLAFSPDGTWLASSGMDSAVALWSTSTWELRHCLRDLSGEILTLLWHPSSLVVLAGGEDAQAAMWNVSKGTLAMYFAGHGGPVTCMAWSPDHKKILTGSGDGGVIVFNPKFGEQEAYITKGLSPDRASVTALCFLGDDDRCVVGCEDGTMHVVSLRAGRAVASMQETHSQAIESLCISHSSAAERISSPPLLISASCDCSIAVWNTADLTLRVVFNVGESVIPAVWAHGHFVVAGCSDGEVKVWDGRSLDQQPLLRFMGHRRMILSLTVREVSGVVATASDDGTVRFFSLGLQ